MVAPAIVIPLTAAAVSKKLVFNTTATSIPSTITVKVSAALVPTTDVPTTDVPLALNNFFAFVPESVLIAIELLLPTESDVIFKVLPPSATAIVAPAIVIPLAAVATFAKLVFNTTATSVPSTVTVKVSAELVPLTAIPVPNNAFAFTPESD